MTSIARLSRTPLLDRRGNEIRVGSRVAYNLSGDVALGEVVRLTRGFTSPIFILPDPEWNRLTTGTSRVRHRFSVVVLP